MALELNKLTHFINAIGVSAAQRVAALNERLPVAEALLKLVGGDDEALSQKIAAARRLRWVGAIPTSEKPGSVFGQPAHPSRVNVAAADGSQIYPDRHGVALYYLINVGSIVFRHGLNEAPSTTSSPAVFFEDEDLFDAEDQSAVNGDKVNTLRDVRELGELARLAAAEARSAPTVTILDNGLLLYLALREQNRGFADTQLDEYLTHLDRLRESGAVPVGVVDRPRAANVIRLLLLARLEHNEIGADTLRNMGPFLGVTDAMLFGFLKPGERSALFVNAAPDNDAYERRGHRIYFFYLNAGRQKKDAVLRIEVPEWVAKDQAKLELAHAAVMEQCRVSDGFPYVLMRAHELAVVSVSERKMFDEMVIGALIRRGLSPSVSQKALGKQWTASGRRKYPRG